MPTVIKGDDETLVKSPLSVKTFERQLGQLFSEMIRAMGKQFKNQTINQFTKKTINKFEDADKQNGNYSFIFMKLSEGVIKKIVKRFSEDRIKKIVTKLFNSVDEKNKEQLYNRLERGGLGINAQKLIRSDGTRTELNALILETVAWASRLRDNSLEDFTANTLRSMALGQDIDEVAKTLDKLVTNRANHSKFLANNQVGNFNSLLTKVRAQRLGITEAIWVTSEDEKVRKCHRVRNGKKFKLSKGLFSSCDGLWLLPAVDYNCRCNYNLIIPDELL